MKVIVTLLFILLIGLLSWGVYRNKNPRNIGIHQGRLSPCPSSPNCVSSFSSDSIHAIEPLIVPDDQESSPIDKLAEIIEQLPRTKIIQKTPDYIHAEFRSKIFSFVDDVEFHYMPEKGVLHVRSASRVGYGDWGVNRVRVEQIRAKFNESI